MIEIESWLAVLKQDGILHSVTKSDNFIRPFAMVCIPIPIRRRKTPQIPCLLQDFLHSGSSYHFRH